MLFLGNLRLWLAVAGDAALRLRIGDFITASLQGNAMNIIQTIRYHIRWWRWFLGGPSIIAGIIRGWNKPTRDIIFERWLEREPRRNGSVSVGHPPVFYMRQDQNPLVRKKR